MKKKLKVYKILTSSAALAMIQIFAWVDKKNEYILTLFIGNQVPHYAKHHVLFSVNFFSLLFIVFFSLVACLQVNFIWWEIFAWLLLISEAFSYTIHKHEVYHHTQNAYFYTYTYTFFCRINVYRIELMITYTRLFGAGKKNQNKQIKKPEQ